MRKKLKILANFSTRLAFIIVAFSVTACRDHRKPTWEYMPNMVDSPAVKAQKEPMRVPPEGTTPVGFERYPYKVEEGDLAGQQLKNPLARTRESFLRGQKMFNTYCIVCHGPKGEGDGSIIPKFPRPPTLLSDKVREWSDGRIYHVVTKGQNLMPSYATQIKPEDRWAIIHYVRAIQRATKPTVEDIGAAKKRLSEGKNL
jgi:mono/diheme cytochrome c family protein